MRKTHYAKAADGVHIAYQVFGDGPHDLVIHPAWLFNVDACWDVPEIASFLESFGRYARVIVFDRRGFGVSDRPASRDVMAVEKGMEDIRAVMDAVGSTRAALLGCEAGGTVALLFAASYPERVSALGLVAPLVFYWKTPEFPWGWTEQEDAEFRRRLEDGWGTEQFWRWNMSNMSDRTPDADEIAVWARFTRLCASPQAILAITDAERQVDVRALLPQIQVPTLVMRSRGDRERGDEGAAPWIAEQIPGARYAELPSGDHIPFEPRVYRPFEDFLCGIREHESVFDRVLATVLFTDIVDSTARSAGLGDRAWRQLREQHDQLVRTQLALYRGREIKNTGDGFLATFDGPARGVRCAQAIVAAVGDLEIEVRAGLHTGEIELDGGDVAGIAVAIGARVGAMAEPSEVLVSQTIKDLTAGSGIVYAERGERELKGVPDRWRLYRAAR
jgi:pimeloyl-ACP methyl ester carboxylesterase/class 3 adenylate cyclase